MKNKKLLLAAGIIAVSAVLAIVGYFMLPDVIAVQITMSGEVGNTMPKLIGLLIPFAVSAGTACVYYKTESGRYLLLSMLGIALSLLIIFTNLA